MTVKRFNPKKIREIRDALVKVHDHLVQDAADKINKLADITEKKKLIREGKKK